MELEWIDFYKEMATKLMDFKNDRRPLIEMIYKVYENTGMKIPTLESGGQIIDIDPFTVFGLFNRGITNANRKIIMKEFGENLDIEAVIPEYFDGIPVLNPMKSAFYAFKDERKPDDIDNLWDLFQSAIFLADEESAEHRDIFMASYDKVREQQCIKWNITMGLYWIRPYYFVNLDGKNREYIVKPDNMPGELATGIKEKIKDKPTAVQYLQIKNLCQEAFNREECKYNSFPELSYYAWKNILGMEQPSRQGANGEDIVAEDPPISHIMSYTKADFLRDVYMSEDKYDRLVTVLKRKKNIILQGAPGVGKTFATKRLAYSLMEEKDDSRMELVQFHQNYSYEDFVMGYKPDGEGFKLQKGVFYRFCERASEDTAHDYFFIIDEINRGNLSKIFGELLMLIENDYRGTEAVLPGDGKKFAVPKNLYIIGMMNTADRSLAMMDYALRRRFSFFDMEPAYDTEGFRSYQENLHSETLNRLIQQIVALNRVIAEDASLGKGFCIGHSYFCGLEADKLDELQNIVEFDILPMLAEYWFDEPQKLQQWQNALLGVFHE